MPYGKFFEKKHTKESKEINTKAQKIFSLQ
jgi:hypothetical protein